MNTKLTRLAFACAAWIGWATLAEGEDPSSILRKPIPDKLVVLTFDDGCASHATTVAPLLKSLNLGGSFYVCDGFSFNTRKDWYLTWRQMKALAADGFEIGNHTYGHTGGSSIGPFLIMEDELLAHDIPKPITVCWPVYQVNPNTYHDLVINGYTFGRGGHERPYRPTVDNPFDVPSFTIRDGLPIENFVHQARQASGGKIVVFCYHGVPDGEHPGVGLDPKVFKIQMQYLKDNKYKVIGLRELAEFIDPAKAARLPPTAGEFKEPGPVGLAQEDKPIAAIDLLAPKPEIRTSASTAKDMLTFVLPTPASVVVGGSNIDVYVPTATDVKAIAPTFTLSPLATAVPASGTVRDFAKPLTYTVTAPDGSSQVYTVTVLKSDQPNEFTWNGAATGNWSDAAKWSNKIGPGSSPAATGKPNYVLNFEAKDAFAASSDFPGDFELNQLNCAGPSVKLDGQGLVFSASSVMARLPRINQRRGMTTVGNPVKFASDVTVDVDADAAITMPNLILGPGRLIKQGTGRMLVTHANNTFSGGTVINGGTLMMYVLAQDSLGSGSITLNRDGTLALELIHGTNPLILNGGTIYAGNGGGDSWNAPIKLNGNTNIDSYAYFTLNEKSDGISGPGSFTFVGGGTVTLCGSNTYTGSTTVRQGTMFVRKTAALYQGDTASWTPEKITIFNTATLRLSVGGLAEFTTAQAGTLLKNLTTDVNRNGLMAGSVFGLDTAGAMNVQELNVNIADSKGPGGGPFTVKKYGSGTLRLSSRNTYTGRTILEGGILSVASLNRVVGGQESSGLGVPTTLESAMIGISGDCTLTYTGKGEVTDRIIDLTGQTQTVTLNQAGSGLLKFTSPFDISGFGHSKSLVLTGEGTGELAGNIGDPYDRKGAATTALTKSGTGVWILSGVNSFKGQTMVAQGTLALANVGSLSSATELAVAEGAALDLRFQGELPVAKLSLGGKALPAGKYSAANMPDYIKGPGVLSVQRAESK